MVNPVSAAAAAGGSNNATASNNSRRSFALFGRHGRLFQFRPGDNVWDTCLDVITWSVEKFVLILGPLLIIFASTIIYGLTWTFFTILLPMMQRKHAATGYDWIVYGHVAFVVFLLVEICFNYYMCVRTPNKGPSYDKVVRELARATSLDFPETPQQVEMFRRDYEMRMSIRVQRRHQRSLQEQQQQIQQQQQDDVEEVVTPSNGNGNTMEVTTDSNLMTSSPPTTSPTSADHATTTSNGGGVKIRKTATRKASPVKQQAPLPSAHQIRSWMLMAPDEWGYCARSHQPKPPRAHYDHVTKTLVLCLDHYCPWMFNAIGYFNYRYFCNFLWFVELAMIYGAIVAFEPFQNTSGVLYRHQVQEYRKTGEWKHFYPMVPTTKERLPVSLAFMLCLAVGIAVACLGGFHLYLCMTAQTTIEFHGNFTNRRKAARLNKKWINPYSLGSYKRNFQQVYGASMPIWKAILMPSKREPEFLPLPMPGDKGLRIHYQTTKDNKTIESSTATTNGGEEIV